MKDEVLIWDPTTAVWLCSASADDNTRNRWEAYRWHRNIAEAMQKANNRLVLCDADDLPYEKAAREILQFGGDKMHAGWQCQGCGKVWDGGDAQHNARWCCHTSIICSTCGVNVVTGKYLRTCESCKLKRLRDKRPPEQGWPDSFVAREDELREGDMLMDSSGNLWVSVADYLANSPESGDRVLTVARSSPLELSLDETLRVACKLCGCDDSAHGRAAFLAESGFATQVREFNALLASHAVGSHRATKRVVVVPITEDKEPVGVEEPREVRIRSRVFRSWMTGDKRGFTKQRWQAGRFPIAEARLLLRDHPDNEIDDPQKLGWADAARDISCKVGFHSGEVWQCLGCGDIYNNADAEEMARSCCATDSGAPV